MATSLISSMIRDYMDGEGFLEVHVMTRHAPDVFDAWYEAINNCVTQGDRHTAVSMEDAVRAMVQAHPTVGPGFGFGDDSWVQPWFDELANGCEANVRDKALREMIQFGGPKPSGNISGSGHPAPGRMELLSTFTNLAEAAMIAYDSFMTSADAVFVNLCMQRHAQGLPTFTPFSSS